MSLQHVQPPTFEPLPPASGNTVTWIHLGDLHMKEAGAQNDLDLGRIVEAINEVYAKHGVSFVFLPGDIADDGSVASYGIVRSHLDKLQIPWCGIVGDHDVHEESFQNFKTFIAKETTSAFTVGNYRFLRLNAFSEPRPDSFILDDEQLAWIERELQSCQQQGKRAVLLLHCYPSELKRGGSALIEMLREYPVLLVDMGHTHYNEISNDGSVLYSATRSTGQIEEGPVGFSVVTLDGDDVSWHFVQLDSPELAAITTPSDRKLETGTHQEPPSAIPVRTLVWSRDPVTRVQATLNGQTAELKNEDGVLWTGQLPAGNLSSGTHRLQVEATTGAGRTLSDAVEVLSGPGTEVHHAILDHENAIGAWEERGILGTKLGPNRNGKKW